MVGFRGYAQRDPLNEYKSESFELFQALLGNLRQAVTAQLMRVELVREAAEAPPPEAPQAFGQHIDATTGEDDFDEGDFGDAAVMTRVAVERAAAVRQTATPPIPRPGARSAATRPARAARARSSSTATARSDAPHRRLTDLYQNGGS